jgi:hypothetical protein
LQRKRIRFFGSPRAFILAGMDQPIMTNLSETFGKYVRKQGKQAAVAAMWLERWAAGHPSGPTWQLSSVESQLSRLMNDEPQGVRFFFEDPARTELLYDILTVPTKDRERIRTLAEKVCQTAPRLIVDISAWSGPSELLATLFDELEQKVLRDCPLQPIALVLTEDQWARLPQKYAALRALQQHRVASEVDGPSKAAALADGDALVLAPWPFDPVDRWVAAEFKNNSLSFEPCDGLAAFAEHGVLPALPAVEDSLADICEPENVTFRMDAMTPAQRRSGANGCTRSPTRHARSRH